MKIPCFRCGKELDTPNASNADYVIASDTIIKEHREVFIALKHNQATLEKRAMINETKPVMINGKEVEKLKYPGLTIDDSEYDRIEVLSIAAARTTAGEDLVKVVAETKEVDIQKTGICCPDCYKDTDQVIWGVHKLEKK